MSGAPDKGCTVAYATPGRQFLWPLRLPAGASIGDALAAARAQAGDAGEAVPWDRALVGIFGQVRRRSDGFADGDRIEIYRPLAHDPRERRREQVARARRAGRGG
ncbi:MAG: RnfH family protein [Proteobacteria bacterium]|nr:RnfH family protein [Pseudomonadota bacterium]